jgi:phosphoglycerate dehydrogenase-like enzyme
VTDRALRILSHVPEGLLQPVRERFPSVELQVVPEEGALPEGTEGEVLLTYTWASPNFADLVTHGVRWVHTFGTGVDVFPFEALGERSLTCSRGASAIPISEWVLAVMLAFEKQLPDTWVHEPPERWSVGLQLGGLHGRTLGLVGLGGIGTAVAARARAFGMRVLAYRRTGRPSEIDGVEVVARLEDVLAAADHLVLAAPATSATEHLLDADAFSRMKAGVHVVNIARGELVDQDALRLALADGTVACASLDVAVPEPLPAGHWLYEHPKVRLSAHTSWAGPGALDGLLEPFLENLRRYLDDAPLEYRVDVAQRY